MSKKDTNDNRRDVRKIIEGVQEVQAKEAEELMNMPPLTEEEEKVFQERCGAEFVKKILSGEVKPGRKPQR